MVGDREDYTKVFRCVGCGAIARVTFSEDHARRGGPDNPARTIEAVEGAFTARMTGARTFTVHCNTCGTDKAHE